jgi:uncharacterized membrane protein YeaQ/YmgE (transglycosylase-associated protein family)
MVLGDILMALVGGTIIGLLGKWVAPSGKDDVPLWLTIVCGIGGVVIGTYLYGLVFDPTTTGIDWWRHAWQVAAAAVLVVIATAATGRQRTKGWAGTD